MTATRTTRPVAQYLFTVARHWRDLEDALDARQDTWPPARTIATISRHRTDDEAEAAHQRAAALRELERSADQIGWAAAPLRLSVLDTMTTVEAALLELADQIAAEVQHTPLTPARPRHSWPSDPRARRSLEREDNNRNMLALKQSNDPRRWTFNRGERTAVRASLWLLARTQGVSGPWKPLDDGHRDRIATVAHACARMVEHALDVGDERVRLAAACPHCAGPLDMHGGAGALPVVRCVSCGNVWTDSESTSKYGAR